jgi:sulfite oxidase
VSADLGKTWEEAKITYREGPWSWVLWEAVVPLSPDKSDSEGENGKSENLQRRVWSRATDEGGNTQMPETNWNLRGVVYCAYGEMVF